MIEGFGGKGPGILDPFKKYNVRSDEPIDIHAVRFRSHQTFSFHKKLPKNFDKTSILTAKQWREMRIYAERTKARLKELEKKTNESKYIVGDILDEVIIKAGVRLFVTPVPTEIPTDSFADDYELPEMKKLEADLLLAKLEDINKAAKKGKVKISTESLMTAGNKRAMRRPRTATLQGNKSRQNRITSAKSKNSGSLNNSKKRKKS